MRKVAQPQAIRVNVSAMERLRREVMAGFSSPEGRRETGGLLLGARSATGEQVTIEAIHPLPCDYTLGATYALDDAGTARMREAVRQLGSDPELNLTVLGFYRGHVRPDIYADFRDLSLLQACFEETGALCLLVKPFVSRPFVGALFFSEEGRLQRHPHNIEFPRESYNPQNPETRPPQPSPAPAMASPTPNPAPPVSYVPPAPPVQQPPPPPPAPDFSFLKTTPPSFEFLADDEDQEALSSPVPVRRINSWLLVGSLAGLVLLATGFLLWQKWRGRESGGQKSATASRPAQASFGMNVERVGNDLRVSWNRLDSTVSRAQAAILIIHDGSNPRQDILLDGNQIRNGSVLYSPVSGYVQFRLELLGQDVQGASESVLAISGRQNTSPPAPVPTQPTPPPQYTAPPVSPPPSSAELARRTPLASNTAAQLPAASQTTTSRSYVSQPVASPIQPPSSQRAGSQPAEPKTTSPLTPDAAPRSEPPSTTIASAPPPPQPASSQPRRIFVPPASGPGNQQARVVVVDPPAMSQGGTQAGAPTTIAQNLELRTPPPTAPPPVVTRAADPPPTPVQEAKPVQTAPKPEATIPTPETTVPKPETIVQRAPAAPKESVITPPAAAERPTSVAYVPPRPVTQVQPTLPREIRGMLFGEATVDVRVKIDATGRVSGVQAVSKPGPLRPFLERAALDAARLWRFSPAQMGDRPVAGETVVQFTFRSSQGR